MEDTNKQLSIGEVGVIHGKTVLCAEDPTGGESCHCCAFYDLLGAMCPFCSAAQRIDGINVYYPEITKGL